MASNRFADERPCLLGDEGWPGGPAEWGTRQAEMTRGYAELLEDREHAVLAFRSDYGPLAGRLGSLTGSVLDVGGGSGVARHWLPAASYYCGLEPSYAWLEQDWRRLADVFPCLEHPPLSIRGVGERMPFADATFDAVLCLWTLNHTFDPGAVLREIGRVLRNGGRLLVVLEEMPPSWGDVVHRRYPACATPSGSAWLLKLRSMMGRFPLSDDHRPIRERDLRRWSTSRFAVVDRQWIGAYLTYELRKVR